MDNARGEAREALGVAKGAGYGAMWNPTVIRPLSRKNAPVLVEAGVDKNLPAPSIT
jgi:hypothetical protein